MIITSANNKAIKPRKKAVIEKHCTLLIINPVVTKNTVAPPLFSRLISVGQWLPRGLLYKYKYQRAGSSTLRMCIALGCKKGRSLNVGLKLYVVAAFIDIFPPACKSPQRTNVNYSLRNNYFFLATSTFLVSQLPQSISIYLSTKPMIHAYIGRNISPQCIQVYIGMKHLKLIDTPLVKCMPQITTRMKVAIKDVRWCQREFPSILKLIV